MACGVCAKVLIAVVIVIAATTATARECVTDALVMAIWRRGRPDALLHHSDRGSTPASSSRS